MFFKNRIIMITYCAKLELEEGDDQKLQHTLELHSLAWNEISKTLFKTGVVQQAVLHKKTYRNIRKMFPEIPSQVIIKARMDCRSAYKTARSSDVPVKEPMIRRNLAMRLDTHLFLLKRGDDGSLLAMLTVSGNKWNRIKAKIVTYPKLLEMMRYEMADPLVFKRNGRFWLAMSFRTPEATHVPDHCIGIDLGVKRLAVTSEGQIINLPILAKAKRRVRYLKSILQSLKRRQGRRRNKSARRKLKTVRRKERNISKEMSHRVANQILTTKATTLILEDLTGLKKKNNGRRNDNRLSQVPLFETRRILTYKAQALGRRVETVNPAYTSKDDYRGLQRGERKGCRYYASDGKILDADHNAAINIAQRWTVQNDLPISFTVPLRGRQTLWAGPGQRAECGGPLCRKPAALAAGG